MVKKITTVENNVREINDIKDEVIEYAKERIDIEVKNSFKKIEKNIIKQKNIKIIKRDLIIIILLLIIGFMGYTIYKEGYLNKYIVDNKEVINNKIEDNNEITKPEDETKDISFHKVALDNIYIDNKSDYLEDYYNGNITNELLLSISLNNINQEDINEDEELFFIEEESIKNIYNKLFSNDYISKSFKYNGLSIKYLKTSKQYMSSSEIKNNDNDTKRIITDIKENDNKVVIKTIECLINDNKIFNILTNKEIAKYKDDNSIKENEKNLNKLEYTFIYNNGEYKLESINKIK